MTQEQLKRKRLRDIHAFKALRTSRERRIMYGALLDCGLSRDDARRFRDCSRGHCRTRIKTAGYGDLIPLFNDLIKEVSI